MHQAFKDIIAFWLKKGVAGFRFDAITTLFEDPQWRDEDPVQDKRRQADHERLRRLWQLNDTRTDNLPEVHRRDAGDAGGGGQVQADRAFRARGC